MYRFLLSPRWLGYLALTLAAAMVMVLLGNWQLDRYRQRSSINERIDASSGTTPAEVARVLPAPGRTAGAAGPPPPADTAWSRVTATGRYDSANVILVRSRTVEGQVGYEVLTPLVLADGSAVLVDRGWVPPARSGGAMAQPEVPAAPGGEVTVVGRVHLSESGPDRVERREGRLETRRVAVPRIAGQLPYPVYGAYLLLDTQTPPADPAFVPIPVVHQNNWQNGGYVVQWWIFAVMALVGFGWVARREAHGGRPGREKPLDRAAEPTPVP
ncbi:SURF1 family protein [Micromonospora sp. NPDC049679]|uniref:SURF1 family cytochrome oxidase biogenesis protein n=1 Tax=Micromonospora sp. NPDC049679 TaxID=3155920 RepID=UPI0033FE445B